MEEKCYRDLHGRGEIAGIGLFESLALVAVPILLFPVFTALDINFFFILVIVAALFVLFRLAARVSPFAHGLVSFVLFHFVWPRKLSAHQLEEREYLKRKMND